MIEIEQPNPEKNVIAFSMIPYLQPQDELLDLSSATSAVKCLKKVRLKEPIQFNLEQMPSKINFRFELDENKEQALLGDYYQVIACLEPEEDIEIQEIQLQIDGVEIETSIIQGGEMVQSNLDQGGSNLMQSQTLDESFKSTNISIASSQMSAGLARSVTVLRGE